MNFFILFFWQESQKIKISQRRMESGSGFKKTLMICGLLIFGWGGVEKASALTLPILTPLPTIVPTPPAQQNINTDSRMASISGQLLNLLAEGRAGMQGPGSTETVFALVAPFIYNTNPALTTGSSLPEWDFDPEVELLHSAPLFRGVLLTEVLEADAAIYPDNSQYNLNTFSGQLQANFTDQGVGFDASPFVAYKSNFVIPANNSGYGWVNDVELGFNFNRILGTGGDSDGRRSVDGKDRLEIDFNPGVSQRFFKVNDGSGNISDTGSSAFEAEFPVVYRFNSRLAMTFDLAAYTRYYNVNQVPANEDRVDETISIPVFLGWTMIPDWNMKLQILGAYTQQFSTAQDQNIVQLNTGVNLQAAF